MFDPWAENHFAVDIGPACVRSGGGYLCPRGKLPVGLEGRFSGWWIQEDEAVFRDYY